MMQAAGDHASERLHIALDALELEEAGYLKRLFDTAAVGAAAA
jgi:hypothetical protein